MRPTSATQPWMSRSWSAQTPRQPAEPGPPRVPSAAAAEDRLRAHQARAERRPSALPPRPPASPSPGSPPARARSASAATRPPATRTPPATSSAELRRAAALCRPALLDGAAQPLQAEAGGRVLLVDPLAPGVLRGRGADLQAGWPRRELRAGEAAARRSCGWSRAKSWRRRRRRPRKPTRARLWRGHAVLSTSKQRLGCV